MHLTFNHNQLSKCSLSESLNNNTIPHPVMKCTNIMSNKLTSFFKYNYASQHVFFKYNYASQHIIMDHVDCP